jgi:hypothetical protein
MRIGIIEGHCCMVRLQICRAGAHQWGGLDGELADVNKDSLQASKRRLVPAAGRLQLSLQLLAA